MALNALALGFGSRMAEAVVANRAQAGRQNMAQIAAHEFGAVNVITLLRLGSERSFQRKVTPRSSTAKIRPSLMAVRAT